MKKRVWVVSAGLIFGLAFLVGDAPAQQQATSHATAPKVDFAKDIQPIFQKSCYGCHGPKTQMSGLRLDTRTPKLDQLVVAGKSAESALYQRVAGLGALARMPMGGQLEPAQIALIKDWIDQGAAWRDSSGQQAEVKTHWAFVPPVRPALPKVDDAKWVRDPVDDFVLARLEKEHLSPSAEADRVTLLRRLSLDLIGLPPTPAEVDAFVKDHSKHAYEKQVERLLNSSHYGERWGRIWLDAARYADSNGYEKDRPRQVWFYRDWVINAFNHNLPYNQFVIDQIAGDELPHPTQDQIVATGFLRNSMINEEGGVDPEQFRMEAMFDRMDAIGKGILGVTIQCAQCHDHKFDPLKQVDYYRMLAYLNNTNEGDVAVYTPKEEMQRAEIYRKTREIEASLRHRHADWEQKMAAWEDSVTQNQPVWTVLKPDIDDISTSGQKYEALPDGSFLAGGYAPTSLELKLTAKTNLRNITAFRLELLTDPNLPLGGPGRSHDGMCALSEFKVTEQPAGAGADAKPEAIKFASATADINLPAHEAGADFQPKKGPRREVGPIDFAIDGKNETSWIIDAGPGVRNQSRKAVFTAATPIANPDGTLLTIYLGQKLGGASSDNSDNNNIGRFRLSVTTSPGATADPLPQTVREALAVPRGQRTPDQVETIFRYWRTTVPEWRDENETIAALWKGYPEGTQQLVLADRQVPRETHVLVRGDFLHPAKVVSPGVPSFLNAMPADAPPTRLSFARWMVDRKSPTTARAFVNRVWQAYFGIGIVATSENLGTQCEPPSHPQLLDWLAVQFMDSGWDVKALQRLIVESATYRQSSNVTPALEEKDPYNRLLARGPRFRVDAEIVRDIALEASGLLDNKIGGPSVHPPAPAFLFKPPASYAPKVWVEDKGPDRYRRAIYTFRYRSVPYPMLQAFDAPNGDASCVRRARSNTPLQALTTLNEPLFVESARALALRTLRDGGADNQQRITYAFRRCLARKPSSEESSELLSLLNKEQTYYASGKLNPWDLAANDPAHPPQLPEGASAPQLAAWTAVSRVLLNLDETITKE